MNLAHRLAAPLVALGLAAALPAANDAPPMWVHGSFVNLRQAARNDAAVVARWPTNTKVARIGEAGIWCEVEGPDQARGFVHCALLGAAPLTLADLRGAKPGDDARRAFWIAPSWGRLAAAGDALTATLLSAAQRENEFRQQKALRWPVPEFEAMKARLREGAELDARVEIGAEPTAFDPAQLPGLPAKTLSAVRPSLFRARTEIALKPTVDELAALRNSRLTLRRILRGPVYGSDRFDEQWIDGTWDIGEAELGLEPPAVSYALTAGGLLAATTIASVIVGAGPAESACGSRTAALRSSSWRAKQEARRKGFAMVSKDVALLSFYSVHDLKADRVEVRSRQFRMSSTQGDGKKITSKALAHEIDLDGDGVADIALLTGQTPGQISPFLTWSKILVNINGVWSLESDYAEDDCT